MIILYSTYEDLASAQLLQKQFGGTIVKRLYGSGPYVTTENIIIIGGQLTNDTYAYYMNLYPSTFPEIQASDAGYGFVRAIQISSQKVYAAAGWNRIDTVTASTWFLENGLPTANYDVQAAHGIAIIQLKLTEEARQTMVSNPNGIIDYANNYLLDVYGSNYKIVWYNLNGDMLEIVCYHNFAPFIVGAFQLALIIAGLIVVIGVVSYVISDATTGSALKVSDIAQVATDFFNNAVEQGVPPETAIKGSQAILDGYNKGLDVGLTGILKNLMYVALVGAGVYAFIVVGVPLLKGLTEKKSKGGKK